MAAHTWPWAGKIGTFLAMCGRFTLRASSEELAAFFETNGSAPELRPRYNVAPSQPVAVVRAEGTSRELAMLRWGLIPGWAKDPAIGSRLINARAETAREKPAFRDAFAARRCLIPADGFYEWQRSGEQRHPWFIGTKMGGLFAFAGLWEQWRVRADARLGGTLADARPSDTVETCTILTTEANAVLASIHDRMPVILPQDAFGSWLAGEAVALTPYPPEALSAHRVSALVNRPGNDDPRCAEPLADSIAPGQLRLM